MIDIHFGYRQAAEDGGFAYQFFPGMFSDPFSELLGDTGGDDNSVPGFEHLGSLISTAARIAALGEVLAEYAQYSLKPYVLTPDLIPRKAPVRPPGWRDTSNYDFTGTMETQYHHRQMTPDVITDIQTRKESIDDYYDEMRSRSDKGLPEIDFNEWIKGRSVVASLFL